MTSAPATLHRQKPRYRTGKLLTWPISFLLDRHGDLSTTKILLFGILGCYAIGKPIPALVCTALITGSFGYTAWKDFIARGSWNAASVDSVTVEHRTEERTERKEFAYTVDGVPASSLPALANAKTPAGDD